MGRFWFLAILILFLFILAPQERPQTSQGCPPSLPQVEELAESPNEVAVLGDYEISIDYDASKVCIAKVGYDTVGVEEGCQTTNVEVDTRGTLIIDCRE